MYKCILYQIKAVVYEGFSVIESRLPLSPELLLAAFPLAWEIEKYPANHFGKRTKKKERMKENFTLCN